MSDLCLPGLGRGFLHHPSNKLDSDELNGFGPCDEATSCPCAPVGLLPPVELMSPQSTYLHTERPTGAIHGSWSPLAPCKEQGIWTFLENHSKMSSFSVLVVLRLIYLLRCGLFWNLERDNKGKTNPQGWVAESLHSGLWVFVPVAHQPQQVARPLAHPSEPLWPLGWDFELTSPISGWKIFLWLCYVLRPLARSAFSSSLLRWLSSLDQPRLWTLLCSIVPFECSLLTQHQHLPLNADEGIWRRS